MTCSNLYQNRDQSFYTGLTTGESATEFISAKYEIFEEFKTVPFVTKTTNTGITIEGDDFKTTINADDLPKAGKFYHQFTVTNKLNQELPPIFSGTVKIKEVR